MLLQGVTLASCLLQRGVRGSEGYRSSIKWWKTSPLFAVTIVQTSRPWYNQTWGKNLVASKMHCCIPTAERILPRSLACREHSRHYSQPSFSSCFKSNKSSLKELWNRMLLSTWLGPLLIFGELWRFRPEISGQFCIFPVRSTNSRVRTQFKGCPVCHTRFGIEQACYVI